MKGIKLLLAVLLAPLAFQAAADDASDIARAATRRDSATATVTSTRQKSSNSDTAPSKTTASRATNIPKSGTTVRERTSDASSAPRAGNVVTRTATIAPMKNITARTATPNIQPRMPRATDRTTTSRAAMPTSRTVATTTRSTTKSRAATQPTRARTAITATPDMLNRDFSKCRTVFYDCMDEFCANKDTQLKRCACSSRLHEFDGTKQNLANVEDKLLDFSQRLLTVNMEREDAEALYTATEGELAFNTKDTSDSKKLLDEISKKLNNSFNDNNFDQNLNAISLSLNMDSAFDTLDSMAGASTTAKSGTDLYVSALPVCREMAMEVCSADDLAIAESSYQMAIESDCNTVKKSYQTQVDRAHEQVFESGALLDMSRLDIHQKRNSDDILTCKRKMLDMLTDSTVCGDDMGKCLDTSGRYIDPTTGAAFLTTELANMATLISRPETGQTWRTAPGNDRFITFLNSKKKFLEPAMENCQDISDYVWDSFIEDALAQIKLAQESKLEEVRQSCTTLTTQCLDDTYDSITEFDARALSIFGVAADQTVNAMCKEVRTACTALMQTSGGAVDWKTGMTEIATTKTYETILQTCREVGRACIIQACTSVSGNFGLCENIDTSINRKSIINRTACWDEVVNCVASAGADSLTQIQALHALDTIRDPNAGIATTDTADTTDTRTPIFRTFYGEMYGVNNWNQITLDPKKTSTVDCISGVDTNCVHDICYAECRDDQEQENATVSTKCYTCRLAERIWGNCEAPANTELANRTTSDETGATYHNTIKTTNANGQSVDTLLSWFAKNTGTAAATDSCRDTSCRPGYIFSNEGTCVPPSAVDSTGSGCSRDNKFLVFTDDSFNNCCEANIKDDFGNCCTTKSNKPVEPTTNYFGTSDIDGTTICTQNYEQNPKLVVRYTVDDMDYNLVCLGDITWMGDANGNYPNGENVACDGRLVLIDDNGIYSDPITEDGISISSFYAVDSNGTMCVHNSGNTSWKNCDTKETTGDKCDAATNAWSVSYDDVCVTTRVGA